MIQRTTDKSTETNSTSNQPSGKVYWQSLDQLLENPEANQVIDHDFGAAAPPSSDGFSRRRWLQVMGASMAFGAVSGCRNPNEKITPFAFRPQGRIPGIPDNYSTMMEFGGMARSLVAVSYDGRPVKLDGNPDHPDTLGCSDTFTQATMLTLYDPDRSRESTHKEDGVDKTKTWEECINNLKPLLAEKGVAVLSEPSSSLSRQRLKKSILKANKDTRWFEFTSVSSDNAQEGSRLAFGSVHRPVYQLADAKVIVCIDADPLGVDPAGVRLSADFAKSRDADHGHMSRMYCVESDFSTTGASADHRMALRFGQIGPFLAALEEALKTDPGEVDGNLPKKEKTLAAMASDLWKNKGAGVVMVGAAQPPEVHARAFRINKMLNNIGSTVHIHKVDDAEAKPGVEQLKELTAAIKDGSVNTLLILGGNPVFFAPSDLKFDEALEQVSHTAHLSLYRNETSRICQWHLNAAHPLATWGDARSYDGSVCISQPMIAPLFGGRSEIEVLAELLGEKAKALGAGEHDNERDHEVDESNFGLGIVKETLASLLGGDNPEGTWHDSVKNGFIAGTAAKPVSPALADMKLAAASDEWKTDWTEGEPELIFRPSKQIFDGRYANNGWLQELPEFITKLTWDNAALVNPYTAKKLGLTSGKLVNLKVDENQISLPVYVLPGLPNGTICTWLGYGRTAAGRVAGDADVMVDSVGTDIRPLRTSGNWWSVPSVVTDPTSTSYLLATTQDHFQIDNLGRDEINKRVPNHLVRSGTWSSFEEFQKAHPHDEHDDHSQETAAHSAEEDKKEEGHEDKHEDSEKGHDSGHAHHWPEGHHLHFKNFDLTRAGWLDEPVAHKWGMSIDLNKCTGCNTCVIACQAENNIPVVGKEQVSKGREMQWMRIDRYFITEQGDREGIDPAIAHQPLTCQQCEKAPCETVCPVAATVHSDEGLNDMVYNRCIGTRYCGNNCPFKVRRFNYFNYTDAQTFIKIPGSDRLKKADLQLQGMMMNPEVTIRSRGVMEKCTYCVQRIQNAKIKAKTEGNREIGPNEIKPACQDACPTQAIVFGDIQNEKSDVHKLHKNPRAYALLEELNIYPRTKYLARVVNPHPALVEATVAAAH
ncbi:MAG: TAT-variant-translocated molybdopterin oxidoreductase [Planctomycetaceae bacterium]|nr:TAT-variant-translocated molybdopterin oxidoreductase [Planctomycetaceae bacterium]MDG2102327.1 TAT-variant-translocated molybdopterin oxidoreductase [Pirellulaceae bacterium]